MRKCRLTLTLRVGLIGAVLLLASTASMPRVLTITLVRRDSLIWDTTTAYDYYAPAPVEISMYVFNSLNGVEVSSFPQVTQFLTANMGTTYPFFWGFYAEVCVPGGV